jgi:hypothetical protein
VTQTREQLLLDRLADLNKTLTRVANLLEVQLHLDLLESSAGATISLRELVSESLTVGNTIRDVRQEASKDRQR